MGEYTLERNTTPFQGAGRPNPDPSGGRMVGGSGPERGLFDDLQMVWAMFRRRRGIFAGAVLITLALVVVITFQMQPVYKASATVVIEEQDNQLVGISSLVTGVSGDTVTIDTEAIIIQSRQLTQNVVESNQLIRDPEFNNALNDGKTNGLKGWIRSLRPNQLSSTIDPELRSQIELRDVISAVAKNVDVERIGNSRAIIISFESIDPEKAALLANSYAQTYLDSQLDAKFQQIKKANTFLEREIGKLRTEVRQAEDKVEQYREKYGLLNAEGYSLTERQVAVLNTQLVTQRAELRERAARLQSVNQKLAAGESADTIDAVLKSSVIGNLRTKQADIARLRSDLSTRYGEKHPEILKINREARDLQGQIDEEVRRIVASLQGEVDIAQSRVAALENNITRIRSDLSQDNQALVGLRELASAAELSRSQYEKFLAQYQDSIQVVDLTEADAKIGSPASVPISPAFPNKLLNFSLGLVLAIGIGTGLIVLIEVFDSGLRTGEQLERILGFRLLASVPSLAIGPMAIKQTPPQDYLVDKPLSAFAEAYRTIRSEVMLGPNQGRQPQAVAITSTKSGEGKTVTAMCLGRICAMSGDKVLVVDCDIRRRILSVNTTKVQIGLVEILTGRAGFAEAIRRDSKTGLHILPISGASEDLNDIFSGTAFKSLITDLKNRYDLIILDTAPVTAVADTRSIINAADMCIQIVKWKHTSVQEADSASQIIKQLRTPILGAVLTQVDVREQSQYGYHGSYAYYNTHQKYYHD